MRLESGISLGPYKILGLVGTGGMGEVYRARDPRLDRDVAVKVLPASYSQDSQRLRRFEQEAKSVGMLNHPNILTVYDAGSHDGCPYVVSELLEGETLRAKLLGSPLPFQKALEYGLQTTRGLAAAHEKGIIHRDLKPENLFITRDGRVKILDFGLAKLIQPRDSSADVTSLPTQTGVAVVMGTVGYMSPEQVSAGAVDQRSDIFSFGAVLYEMLSGKRAFHRKSTVEILNAILKEDPPRLSEVNPKVSLAVERIVQFCIEKNPGERFQSAADVALALEALSAPGTSVTAGVIPLPRKKMSVRWIAACMALVAILIGSFFLGKERGISDARSKLLSVPSFRPLTFRRGTVWTAKFTPDGFTIVYSASWEGKPPEIFSTRPDSLESRSLGMERAWLLDISSTGELAVLLFPGWRLARVPLEGGAPREILEGVNGADWAPDGKTLLVNRTAGRIEFPIGKVLYEGDVQSPHISPNGNQVAFIEYEEAIHSASICVIDQSRKKKVLSSGWLSSHGVAWNQAGDEIWFRASDDKGDGIFAVDLSGRVRLLTRLPQGSTRDLEDLSQDGRVLITAGKIRMAISGLTPDEPQERDLSWLDYSQVADLSDDGQTLLFNEQGTGGGKNFGVYLRKLEGSSAVKLGDGQPFTLSPDGKWVAVLLPSNVPQLALLPTGAGEEKRLPNSNHFKYYDNVNWFPDGRNLLIEAVQPGSNQRLYMLNLDNGNLRPITPEGTTTQENPRAISPDGKWVLARASDSDQWLLYPIAGGTARLVLGLEPKDKPIQWSSDAQSVFVRDPKFVPANIYKVHLATGRRELWKELKPADPAGVTIIEPVRMTPDSKSYVYSYFRELTELFLVEGLK